MKIRRHLLSACVLAAACGGDSTGPAVETVTVSASTDQITVGETLQFSATAKDASGATVSGEKVSWTSSNTALATVDSTGLVTGVAAGNVSITALVGGVPGSAPLVVLPNTCEGAITVSLQPGEHAVYGPTDCLILPSGALLDRYRVSLVRTMETGTDGDVVTGALKATALGVSVTAAPQAAGAPAAFPSTGPLGRLAPEIRRRLEVTARAHADLRERDRALGPGGLAPTRPVLAPALVSPTTMLFNLGTSCTVTDTASAVLVHENDHVAFYQDIVQRDSVTVDSLVADSVARYYTTYGKGIIDTYFGPPSDIDGNGKLVVLATPEVVGDTAAYVTSRDMRDKASCAASNEMELIYFNTDLLDSRNDTIDVYFALETMVHEAEHVTSLSQSMTRGSFQPTWLEEGRAEIAGEMAGRKAWAAGGGPAPNQRANRNHLVNDGRVNDRNFPIALMVLRSMWWVDSEPNGMMATPDGADDGADIYASGWHFNRWLGDAYGLAGTAAYADSSFFRELTAPGTAQGILGLEAVTGKSYQTLVQEFMAAIATHRAALTEPERVFSTYDFVSLTDDLWNEQPEGTYPFPVTGPDPVTYSSATYSGPMGAGGFRLHDFVSNGTGVGLQLQATLADPSSVIVVRIR